MNPGKTYLLEAYSDSTTGPVDNLIESVTNEYAGFNRLKKVEGIKSRIRALTEYHYNRDDLGVAKVVSKSDNNYTPVEARYLCDRQHARIIIKKLCKIEYAINLHKLDIRERNIYLKDLKEAHNLSIRQIERLTGINRDIIQKG